MIVQAIKGLDEDATIGKLVSRIGALPEFRDAETKIAVRLGSPNSKTGRVAISHAAYTNGGYDVAKAYFQNGVDTLSYIHISEPDLTKLASENFANLVVLGHIASDWLGINGLLRELEKNDIEPVAVTDLYKTGVNRCANSNRLVRSSLDTGGTFSQRDLVRYPNVPSP